MKLKITNEKENILFKRKEVKGIIETETVPKKNEVAKILAEKYKVEPNALRVLNITGKFGSKTFDLEANIYESQEKRDALERMSKKEKESLESAQEKTEEKPEAEPEKAKEKSKEESAEAAKVPAEEAIGQNPVEEAKKAEAEKAEEDKKEKEKTEEEKQLENKNKTEEKKE